MTYDLAFADDWLLACIPHGADMAAAVQIECEKARIEVPETRVVCGVILTDEPLDTDDIVYRGNQHGWLSDAEGRTFGYAVRRAA